MNKLEESSQRLLNFSKRKQEVPFDLYQLPYFIKSSEFMKENETRIVLHVSKNHPNGFELPQLTKVQGGVLLSLEKYCCMDITCFGYNQEDRQSFIDLLYANKYPESLVKYGIN